MCKGGINTVCKECRKDVSKKNWSNKSYVQKIYDRAKTRATRKGREFNIGIEDIVIPEVCPVFGVPLVEDTEYAPSIDRIDSSKGYIKGNIQIISRRANLLKNNANIEELEMVIEFLRKSNEDCLHKG
jgi:hypothetical protein